jgi:hypothetical protein
MRKDSIEVTIYENNFMQKVTRTIDGPFPLLQIVFLCQCITLTGLSSVIYKALERTVAATMSSRLERA